MFADRDEWQICCMHVEKDAPASCGELEACETGLASIDSGS